MNKASKKWEDFPQIWFTIRGIDTKLVCITLLVGKSMAGHGKWAETPSKWTRCEWAGASCSGGLELWGDLTRKFTWNLNTIAAGRFVASIGSVPANAPEMFMCCSGANVSCMRDSNSGLTQYICASFVAVSNARKVSRKCLIRNVTVVQSESTL